MTEEERTALRNLIAAQQALLLTVARVLRAHLSDMGHQDVRYLDEALAPFQGAGEEPEHGAAGG